jgi:hypothetical protein
MEAGVTAIEDKFGPLTVMVVEAEMELEVAEMVAVPCPELVASPLLPTALLMMATVADEELQVAIVVRSCLLPSV